jgi:hypothetical protein
LKFRASRENAVSFHLVLIRTCETHSGGVQTTPSDLQILLFWEKIKASQLGWDALLFVLVSKPNDNAKIWIIIESPNN